MHALPLALLSHYVIFENHKEGIFGADRYLRIERDFWIATDGELALT
jgi:hypothetical protein